MNTPKRRMKIPKIAKIRELTREQENALMKDFLENIHWSPKLPPGIPEDTWTWQDGEPTDDDD